MRLNTVKVLGISITTTSKKEILEEIRKYLVSSGKNTQKSVRIFTPNTEQLVMAQKDLRFADVLNQADVAIPDTVGVAWASRMLTKEGIQKPIPGVEFMEDLVQLAEKCHVPIGLIGGRGKIAVNALECLQAKYPRLTTSNNPGVVFVALGAPKQEYFIEQEAKITKGVVYMAVGGSFDIISGKLQRAPAWMRSLGLEWLWRLILEPWRITRQLALIEFIWLVLRAKISKPSD
jgi:N-acetylglucosaminyldiphosphoundecaprenol N-acetyl-beta-D-mannosaminyltransferase